MPKGYSLHIGLNWLDPKFYNGNMGELAFCENDAIAFCKLAKKRGFCHTQTLLTEQATIDNFLARFKEIATQSKPKDLIFITFSGHGSRKRDINGDEADGWDETWCFYDGQILDDKINELLSTLPQNQRVFIIADNCHSGTIVKDVDFFSSKLKFPKSRKKPVLASVKLFAACQDNEYASEGQKHGLFTQHILTVWDNGRFRGDYTAFFEEIYETLPSIEQYPKHFNIGPKHSSFPRESPFKI